MDKTVPPSEPQLTLVRTVGVGRNGINTKGHTMNATGKAIVVLAALVAGAVRAEEVVLRFETANEVDARTGISRGLDARGAAGYSEFLRLRGNAPVVPGVAEGRQAGNAAVQRAGTHAARITDAEVMRRAAAAVKASKLTGDAAEAFRVQFVAAFTDARMKAR